MQLATIQQQQTMTSREIAELTGKEHLHVMRDIRDLLPKLKLELNQYIQNWIHPQNGREYQEFLLDKDLTLTLLTGYDAGARYKVVKRWQELDNAPQFKVPTTLAGALRLAAEQAELIEQQRPAVEFVEKYTKAENGSMTFRQVCKHLKANEARFREFLFDNEIMYRLAGNLMAYQNHIDAGRFEVTTDTFNNVITTKCHFTGKGVVWISEKWDKAKSQ